MVTSEERAEDSTLGSRIDFFRGFLEGNLIYQSELLQLSQCSTFYCV